DALPDRRHAAGHGKPAAVRADRDDLDSILSRRSLDLGAAGRRGKAMSVKFRVELVWQDSDASIAESIFLTSHGPVILQGRPGPAADRQALSLPQEAALISVDRRLARAIQQM